MLTDDASGAYLINKLLPRGQVSITYKDILGKGIPNNDRSVIGGVLKQANGVSWLYGELINANSEQTLLSCHVLIRY